MSKTDQADGPQPSDYVAALHREAAGYIKRQNWKGLDAVNAELVKAGEKPIAKPSAAKGESKPAKK